MATSRKWRGSDARLEALVAEHGETILRVARRYSASAEDAEDVYQHALEKFITKAPPRADAALPWLLTIVRNEALMIRRKQSRIADSPVEDAAADLPAETESPEERTLDVEHLAQGREALRRLKPDQARCMLLRADGLSYDEIARATGFSYAKVQRSLWEGRKLFSGHVARVESGDECKRIEPLISTLVDNAVTQEQRLDVEMHLETCLACRIVLRDFRTAPTDLAAIFPVGVGLAEPDRESRALAHLFDAVHGWINERAASVSTAFNGSEAAVAKKSAAIVAVTASVVAGGAGVEKAVRGDAGDRVDRRPTPALAAPEADRDLSDERDPVPDERRKGETDQLSREASAADLLDAPAPASAPRETTPAATNSDPATHIGEGDGPVADEPIDEPIFGSGE